MSLTIGRTNDLEQSGSRLQTKVKKRRSQTLRRAWQVQKLGGKKHNDKLATCRHVTPACKVTAQVSVIQQRDSVLLSFATGAHTTLLRGVSVHFKA